MQGHQWPRQSRSPWNTRQFCWGLLLVPIILYIFIHNLMFLFIYYVSFHYVVLCCLCHDHLSYTNTNVIHFSCFLIFLIFFIHLGFDVYICCEYLCWRLIFNYIHTSSKSNPRVCSGSHPYPHCRLIEFISLCCCYPFCTGIFVRRPCHVLEEWFWGGVAFCQ